MNLLHRRYCRSDAWASLLGKRVLPWVLEGVDLGNSLLEIGPGPGRTTDYLRERVASLTCIEVDHTLAQALNQRLAGTNVTVIEGDGTATGFPDSCFDSAVSLTMLHHVPSRQLQDRLLTETFRVLRPGGWFAGTDSRSNLRWRPHHLFDTCVAVDPATFGDRLAKAGFVDASVEAGRLAFRFRARKP